MTLRYPVRVADVENAVRRFRRRVWGEGITGAFRAHRVKLKPSDDARTQHRRSEAARERQDLRAKVKWVMWHKDNLRQGQSLESVRFGRLFEDSPLAAAMKGVGAVAKQDKGLREGISTDHKSQ